MEGVIEGRTYNFVPRFPSSIEEVASRLLENEACFVSLEPGDATRYDFYLIPQTGKLRIPERFGLGTRPWEDKRYIWFAPANLNVHIPGDIVSLSGGSSIFFDLTSIYTNVHTCKILAIFLDLVNQALSDTVSVADVKSLDSFAKSSS